MHLVEISKEICIAVSYFLGRFFFPEDLSFEYLNINLADCHAKCIFSPVRVVSMKWKWTFSQEMGKAAGRNSSLLMHY